MTAKKRAGAETTFRRVMPLRKPPFLGDAGGWEDLEFLPASLRLQLLPVILERQRHTPQEADDFLAACARAAQIVLDGRRRVTFAHERDQIEAVADAARDLLKAMQRLGGDAVEGIEAHTIHPTGLLSRTWDWVEVLEGATRDAVESIPSDARSKPDALTAAELTRLVVQAYWRRFGTLPPISQDGWFVAFMQRLGAHFGLQTGARPVRDAIDRARANASANALRSRTDFRE